jgi:hypothetical protein
MTWYNKIGKKVWFYELFEFFFKNKGVPELIKNTLVKNLKVTNYQILIKKECQ